MAYVKFYCTPTPRGSQTAVRVVAGENRDQALLAGTLVMDSAVLEEFLDAITMGASMLAHNTDPLVFHFGPENFDTEI